MAIPKTIVQTFKSSRLPLLTRWHIRKMKKANPGYSYEFFDDSGIEDFIRQEYGTELLDVYKRLDIGAAKADFFRYAYLYKKGGVYLDIDSLLTHKLDDFINPDDSAVIALEGHLEHFVQWALIYEAGHPFLEKTISLIVDNIKNNRYPHDVHKMTGPAAYSQAIRECLKTMDNINFRQMGADYDGKFNFSYAGSKLALYGPFGKGHWKKEEQLRTVLG